MKNKTVSMVQTAVLLAILLLMAFTPIGFLRIGPLSISFITIPVAVGAVMISPGAGAVLGCAFGITSFIQCFTGDVLGAALVAVNIWYTLIVCLVPRILAGWFTGLLFRLLQKKWRHASYFIGGFAMAFFNTLFFMTLLVLFFWNVPAIQEWSASLGALHPLAFILASVTVNAVVEWVSTTIVTGAVGLALSKSMRKKENVR